MTRPWYPGGGAADRLRAHARRVGADRAAATDPTAALQLNLLRHTVAMLEAALDDEDIAPTTAQRVLDRVIYGCTPNPAEVAERERLTQLLIDRAQYRAPTIIGVPADQLATLPRPEST
jgi:hypothetical protein